MFGIVQLSGTPESGIDLETRLRRRIDNTQPLEPGYQDEQSFNLLLDRHGEWRSRKRPCGGYNCFGLVWASRRTGIFETAEISKILADDGYRKLEPADLPQIGDIVLYADPNRGEFWHGGVITCFKSVLGPGAEETGRRVPIVLSKLNAAKGEVLHPLKDVHSPYEDAKFELEIWTDRPADGLEGY